jgi:DUF971 family protein
MTVNAMRVRRIAQTGNHTFCIEWSDGKTHDYRLSDLQRQCSCAGCVDEFTGRRIADGKAVDEEVRATKIVSVGCYALRIAFASGCSTGIYSYDMLRELGEKKHC